jgi:hypothetical protein
MILRRTIIGCTLTLFLLAASSAMAKPVETLIENDFMTAESLDAGLTQAGIQFSLGEGYQSFYPAFRFGLGALFELGVRAGISTVNSWTEDKIAGLVGVDLKYQLIKRTEGVPVDMAVDLGFDTHIISSKNASDLSFSAIFSHDFPLTERGYKITPYGGLEVSASYGSYFPKNETDYYVFAGAEWKFTQKSMLYVELKGGEHWVGGAGIRFEY